MIYSNYYYYCHAHKLEVQVSDDPQVLNPAATCVFYHINGGPHILEIVVLAVLIVDIYVELGHIVILNNRVIVIVNDNIAIILGRKPTADCFGDLANPTERCQWWIVEGPELNVWAENAGQTIQVSAIDSLNECLNILLNRIVDVVAVNRTW